MGLYKRKNSAFWWMSFSVGNRQFQRSTETTDKKLAASILAKVKTLIVEGKWFEVDAAKQHTFDEMMERFMSEHAPTVAKKTQKSYRNSLAHLKEFFSGSNLYQVDTDMVMQYVSYRREQTCKPGTQNCEKCRHKPESELCQQLRGQRKPRPGTRNRELAMLSRAFNLAKLWKWTKDNPCSLVRREKEDNENTGKCLSESDEAKLLEACRPLCNGQLAEIVAVAVNTALRESEVLGMRWENISMSARTITFIQKGGRERVAAMNNSVYYLLVDKSKFRNISGYVFTTSNGTPFIARNMYREFQKACNTAGIGHYRFHDLKHTVGTRLARAGHDIYAIASVLGHTQLSTAKRYSRHNVQSLRNVVETLDKKDGTFD